MEFSSIVAEVSLVHMSPGYLHLTAYGKVCRAEKRRQGKPGELNESHRIILIVFKLNYIT